MKRTSQGIADRAGKLCLLISATLALGASPSADAALTALKIPITYLRVDQVPVAVLSNIDPIPDDLGMQGAALARKDNSTTGKFLGHDYQLETIRVAPDEDVLSAARKLLSVQKLVLLDAPGPVNRAIADLPEARDALLFNVSSSDTDLRNEACRKNLLHTYPERSMRSDALMQVLKVKQWQRLALIVGPREPDLAYAEALRRSAEKFGLEIVGEKQWSLQSDLRLSASAEVPLLTQDLPDHDVLLVADEADDFGDYIEDNAWLPRPLAGTSGLVSANWTSNLEQWGAAQLQSRFQALSDRKMMPRDFAAWVAVRAIGEAVTRTGRADAQAIRTQLLSPEFRLDGFKGHALSFRSWNGQLREPVPVFTASAVVNVAPLEAFLHASNELDTLGTDKPETRCTLFGD